MANGLEQGQIGDAVAVEGRLREIEVAPFGEALRALELAGSVAERLDDASREAPGFELELRANHLVDAELFRERPGRVRRRAGHDGHDVSLGAVPFDRRA